MTSSYERVEERSEANRLIPHSHRPFRVKSSDPTKKVTLSAATPTASTKLGAAPSAKHSDPAANRTPIHHPAAPGAHHVDP
jgi:hypothetical protein